MRRIGPGSNDEMVELFLLAELDSPVQECVGRELGSRGWSEALIRAPNLADASENARRAELLRECRGWQGPRFILSGVPLDLDWSYVELDRAEVGEVLGARWEPWLTLANPDRRVATAAARAVTALPPGSDLAELVGRAQAVARAYAGGEPMPPPILLASSAAPARLVAVEGHTRLLGWHLSGLTRPFEVLVGTGDLSRWGWA